MDGCVKKGTTTTSSLTHCLSPLPFVVKVSPLSVPVSPFLLRSLSFFPRPSPFIRLPKEEEEIRLHRGIGELKMIRLSKRGWCGVRILKGEEGGGSRHVVEVADVGRVDSGGGGSGRWWMWWFRIRIEIGIGGEMLFWKFS